MPVYEYECPKCQARFEMKRRMADNDAEINCPGCGQPSPERVFSVFGTPYTFGSGAPAPPGG